LFGLGTLNVFGVSVTYIKLISLLSAIKVMILLGFLIRKTRIGKEINAVSQSYESAMLVGIDVERVLMMTILISSILAGIGVAGYVGEVNLGHVVFIGLGAYTSVLLVLKLGTPLYLAITLGALSSTLLGLGIGAVCLRSGLLGV